MPGREYRAAALQSQPLSPSWIMGGGMRDGGTLLLQHGHRWASVHHIRDPRPPPPSLPPAAAPKAWHGRPPHLCSHALHSLGHRGADSPLAQRHDGLQGGGASGCWMDALHPASLIITYIAGAARAEQGMGAGCE